MSGTSRVPLLRHPRPAGSWTPARQKQNPQDKDRGARDPSYRGGPVPPTNPGPEKLQEALDIVNQLSGDERQELLARLSLVAQASTADASRDVDMWATAIHEALQECLGGAGGPGCAPMLVKRAVGARSAFEPVSEFMKRSKLAQRSSHERLSIFRLLADLLVEHADGVAKHVGAPLSVKLVANNTHLISGLFEAAFPGYLAAGLAHIVAARLTARRA